MELKEMEAIRDFTDHKYVIRMMDPADWVRQIGRASCRERV